MSTRANVIIKEGCEKLYFYRHCDGYPEGIMPTLNEFLDKVKKSEIRDNISQSAGWLIIIGHKEYGECESWKVGSYEPTTGLHGDIEHLYVIDLEDKTVTEIPRKKWKRWE